MSSVSIGDIAQQLMLRRHNFNLKTEMQQLTQELTTGQRADLADALTGDYSYLSDIERSLITLDGYKLATTEADLFSQTIQDTLGRAQELTSDLASNLLTASNSPLNTVQSVAAGDAENAFESLVIAFNSDVGGRSLFSGAATNRAPLVDAQTMLNDLRTAASGAATVSDLIAAVDAWFYNAGGDFETTAYLGSSSDISPFQLGDSESVGFSLRADSTEVRDLLRNTALAALAADPALGLNNLEQKTLLREAGESLMTAQTSLTGVRADLGFVQERIESAEARNSAARTSLEMAKSELVAVDQYDAATRLENVQFQLETLYTMTVRLSKLSLMDYMR